MCGIFAFLASTETKIRPPQKATVEECGTTDETLVRRGPDSHEAKWVSEDGVFMAFHRLAIVGQDEASSHIISSRDKSIHMVCNGMIYNYTEILEELSVTPESDSDCEVILHLYMRYGGASQKLFDKLRGVYAFCLWDSKRQVLVVGNDPLGIRPLYQGWTREGDRVFASVPSALVPLCDARIDWFRPGTFTVLSHQCNNHSDVRSRGVRAASERTMVYWHARWFSPRMTYCEEDDTGRILELLDDAVRVRMLGDRPFCALLSGGLDSSTVCALLQRTLRKHELPPLHTFCIGFEGSPDLLAARIVADHIGSFHHEIITTKEEMISAIPEVVRAIQSYDVTTVRASTPQFLLCKHIAENTNFKMVFNGDCSEEIFASYAYSKFAPSGQEYLADNVRLVDEVHMYDGLRSDRTIAYWGMDARTPFADKRLVEYVLQIRPVRKMFGTGTSNAIEKLLLRKQVLREGLLPESVAMRPKTAFSDGVSKTDDSWHTILSRAFPHDPSASLLELLKKHKTHVPESGEAGHYLQLYLEHLNGGAERSDLLTLVPEYWMPRFVVGVTDPSARILK